MPKPNHTESELFLKDQMERLFLLEIAQRSARLTEPKAFRLLCLLRQRLEIFFASRPDQDMDVLENGPDIVFDFVQLGVSVTQGIILSGVDHEEFHQTSVNYALSRFARRIAFIEAALLGAQGFRLADFSHINKMIEVADWWYCITDETFRADLSLEGKIGTVSKPLLEIKKDGRKVSKINVAPICPARIPLRMGRSRSFETFDTENNNITIDGFKVQNSLVLTLDLDEPLPDLAQLRFHLASRKNSLQAKRDLAVFKAGNLPPDRQREEINFTWLLPPTEKLGLATGEKSITVMLRGLVCLENRATADSDVEAIKRSTEALEPLDKTITYEQVEYAFDQIRKKVKSYNSRCIPW